jgi:hypothetical protein
VVSGLALSRHEVRFARRMVMTAGVASITLSTFLVEPATAATVACGTVITADTRLTADVGPCPGIGLVVAADGVTLDLGGHEVRGDTDARSNGDLGPFGRDQPGILLRRVSGAAVVNGTVRGFDAGVVIMGGGSNTVRRITAADNVNYRMVTGRDVLLEDIDPVTGPFCWFGDGISVFNSNGNVLRENVARHNGPFSGISLVGFSDGNVVVNNRTVDNNVVNKAPGTDPNPIDVVGNSICGGIGQGQPAPEPRGRLIQDVGIRVEGPGADDNLVEGNHVRNSGLAGIMVHGVIAAFGPSNGYNVIRRNHVSGTGAANAGLDRQLHGIMLHHSGAEEMNGPHDTLVEFNTSSANLGGGIMLDTRGPGFWGTVIRHNVVNNNGLDGLHVAGSGDPRGPAPLILANEGRRNGARAGEVNAMFGPSANYAGTDGADMGGCSRIVWSGNRFGTVNDRCVAAGGVGWVGGPGKSASSVAAGAMGSLGRGNGRPAELG